MTPEDHARLSVRDYGGDVSDYYLVHYYMDYSKHFVTNGHASHRAMSHNWWGITLIESLWPENLINGVSVRQLLIDHVRQDCEVIPTLETCIQTIANGTYMEKYNKPCSADLQWLKANKAQRL